MLASLYLQINLAKKIKSIGDSEQIELLKFQIFVIISIDIIIKHLPTTCLNLFPKYYQTRKQS